MAGNQPAATSLSVGLQQVEPESRLRQLTAPIDSPTRRPYSTTLRIKLPGSQFDVLWDLENEGVLG
jgi:hypothetical protein